MASNYTTNYKLPLWEGGDDFVREEFNEAHEKVDAALGTMADEIARVDGKSRFTKLKEINVTTATTSLTISLADIDWSQWDKVHLDMYTTNGQGMTMYLNSDGSNYYVSLSNSMSGDGIYLPRMTFWPCYMADRYVMLSSMTQIVTMPKSYTELTRLVISGGTMNAGAKFIFWGEA